MALARANDAVKLAYCQEPTEDEIRRLDLGAVAEFRRKQPRERGDPVHRPGEGIAGAGRYAGGRGLRGGEFFPRDGAGGGGSVKEMIPLSLRQRKAFVWWARRNTRTMRRSSATALSARARRWRWEWASFSFWAMACFSDRQFAAVRAERGRAAAQSAGNGAAAAAKAGLCLRGEAERKDSDRAAARTGKRFYLFGGANEASAALIQGMTLAGVLLTRRR